MNRSKLERELENISDDIDDAITDPSNTLDSEIKGQNIIEPLENFVAGELKETYNFNDNSVHTGAKIYGNRKTKEHDVVVYPDKIRESYLDNGRFIECMGPMMVVSVRSQTKSLDKNYDTIYERLVAEPGEVHARYPHVPFGMVHMLPAAEIEEDNNTKVTHSYELEKYLRFDPSEIGRDERTDPIDRPEALNLLIVDFESGGSLLDTTDKLINKGLITNQFANKRGDWVQNNLLSIESFFKKLVSQFDDRYPLVSDSIRT